MGVQIDTMLLAGNLAISNEVIDLSIYIHLAIFFESTLKIDLNQHENIYA